MEDLGLLNTNVGPMTNARSMLRMVADVRNIPPGSTPPYPGQTNLWTLNSQPCTKKALGQNPKTMRRQIPGPQTPKACVSKSPGPETKNTLHAQPGGCKVSNHAHPFVFGRHAILAGSTVLITPRSPLHGSSRMGPNPKPKSLKLIIICAELQRLPDGVDKDMVTYAMFATKMDQQSGY